MRVPTFWIFVWVLGLWLIRIAIATQQFESALFVFVCMCALSTNLHHVQLDGHDACPISYKVSLF